MKNEEVVKEYVENLRKEYNIKKYPNTVEKKCNECAQYNLLNVPEFYYEHINLINLGITSPFHVASILGFEIENKIKWFIIDPTYGQFFENRVFRNYMFNNYKDFSERILEDGYIECTLSNMLNYINGFVFSGAYVNNVDEKLVYNNIKQLLIAQNIVNEKEFDNLENNKSKTFIKKLK